MAVDKHVPIGKMSQSQSEQQLKSLKFNNKVDVKPPLVNGLPNSAKSISENSIGDKLAIGDHKFPCKYTHEVYNLASQMFGMLKHAPRSDDDPFKIAKKAQQQQDKEKNENGREMFAVDFRDEKTKRLVFELVYSTLKYQRFLEDMLDDSNFFNHYPEHQDEENLVTVMLCDYQQRKFQEREPLKGEHLIPHITHVENDLLKSRTKLNASLARSRIKARVLSIEELLPESVREKDGMSNSTAVYAWVNYLKTDMRTVLSILNSEGRYVAKPEDTPLQGKAYYRDRQCNDLLIFPADQRMWLEEHLLVMSGKLVIQDKSSCLAIEATVPLVNDGDDVLHVNVGAGISSIHLASLLNGQDSQVLAAGVNFEENETRVMKNLDKFRASSFVHLLSDNFLNVDPGDSRYRNVRVALVTANCSRSGVSNPVAFVVSEEEDMDILTALSIGNTKLDQLNDLVAQHTAVLKRVLQIPSVQAVVYCTRSVNEAENEAVVTRVVEMINMAANLTLPVSKRRTFRMAPPSLGLSQEDIEGLVEGKFLRYPPSLIMSGCFIATIVREAEDPREVAREALARAMSKGILSPHYMGMSSTTQTKKSSGKKGSRKKGGHGGKPASSTAAAAPAGVSSAPKPAVHTSNFNYLRNVPLATYQRTLPGM